VEIDNVRTAWNVMVEHQYFPLIVAMAHCLWGFLDLRARSLEAISLFEQTAAKLRIQPASEARNLALGEVLGDLAWLIAIYDEPAKSKLLAEESLLVLQDHAASKIAVVAYLALAVSEYFLAEYEAAGQHAQCALEITQASNDLWYRGYATFLLALVARSFGN